MRKDCILTVAGVLVAVLASTNCTQTAGQAVVLNPLRRYEQLIRHVGDIVFVEGVVEGSKATYVLQLDDSKVVNLSTAMGDFVGDRVILVGIVALEQEGQTDHDQSARVQRVLPQEKSTPGAKTLVLRNAKVIYRPQ